MFASTIRMITAVTLVLVVAIETEAFTTRNTPTTKKILHSSSYLPAIANPLRRRSNSKKKTNIIHVESVEEYKDKVVNENECISVVRFYSQYCKSCRASEPLFYKLASDFSNVSAEDSYLHDDGIKVHFVEVPLNKHTSVLHEALDVPSLPWTHIYHPDAGLVEERAVSKKYINEVRKCLRCYVYGECDLEDAPADCKEVYGECAIDGDEME